MIRWSATVWPLNPEPFCSQGLQVFDTDSRLANSPYAAFVEPMLHQHVAIGPVGCALLVLALASTDAAVRDVAVDATAAAISDGRLALVPARGALSKLLEFGHVPVGRWTRALTELAEMSPANAAFVRDLIAGALRHDPAEPPRNIGGLIELLYELCVATGASIDDEETRAYLRGLGGSGKPKKFAAKLLAIR